MKQRNWRKLHRYLGLIIGVQLFVWTLSGVIFSWMSMKTVRGEHLVRHPSGEPVGELDTDVVARVLAAVAENGQLDGLRSMSIRTMLSRPVVEAAVLRDVNFEYVLFDGRTGERLSPLDESTARRIAQHDFAEDVGVVSVERIDAVGSHSEYRNKDLPAYRVVLDHPTGPVIYVSAQRGMVTARRNNQWRMYDFFWMLHTMDYWGRDSFDTWLLRSVSVFGLATVVTGFVLGLLTSRVFRRPRRRTR